MLKKRSDFEALFLWLLPYFIGNLFQQHFEIHNDGAVFCDQYRVAVDGRNFGDFQNDLLDFLQRFFKRADGLGFFAANTV